MGMAFLLGGGEGARMSAHTIALLHLRRLAEELPVAPAGLTKWVQGLPVSPAYVYIRWEEGASLRNAGGRRHF